MKTYYDRLNGTFGFFESNILPSSAQLVMLWLLHFNNRFGNTGQFYLSDNRLSLLTNLSKGTITNTKRVLKNLGTSRATKTVRVKELCIFCRRKT